MARIGLGKILAGVAGVAAAGAAWIYLRDRGVETPPHETIETDGHFELRRYPSIVVAQTIQAGSRDRAMGNGFGLLADYIFAEGREGDEIRATAPVFLVAESTRSVVRFYMPAGSTIESLPQPGEGIELVELQPRTVALIRFGGRADERLVIQKEAELRSWLSGRGIEPAGPAEHAFYNSPIIPGPLRHNEVMIEVDLTK